jgi:hypothetical protein
VIQAGVTGLQRQSKHQWNLVRRNQLKKRKKNLSLLLWELCPSLPQYVDLLSLSIHLVSTTHIIIIINKALVKN